MNKRKAKEEELQEVPFNIENWESMHVGIYDKHVESVQEGQMNTMIRMIRILPNIKKSSKILVLSSGNGYAALFLALNYGCKVDCICKSEDVADRLKNLINEVGMEDVINITICEFDEINFTNATFDMIWSLDAVSNSDDHLTIFREVNRLLAPEGRFIFSDYLDSPKADDEQRSKLVSLLNIHQLNMSERYMKLADKADLEKVYVREMPEQVFKHFTQLKSEVVESDLSKSEKLNQITTLLENQPISWGVFQFQKRNI
jgi:sarcosine/dimethylglycine N-methyltransferase